MVQNDNSVAGDELKLVAGKTKYICSAYLNWTPIDIFGGYKLPERGHFFEYAPAGTLAPRKSISVWEIKFSNQGDAETAFQACFGILPDTAYLIDRRKGVFSGDQEPEIILNVEQLDDELVPEDQEPEIILNVEELNDEPIIVTL